MRVEKPGFLLLCSGIFLAFVCMLHVSETILKSQASSLVSLNLGQSSVNNIHQNELIRVDVPASQLSSTKIGDIVRGKMKAATGGVVVFTGSVAAGTMVSPTKGAVTVKVISDKYIAPGTPVSGRVGDSMFSGTVVGSPNNAERLSDMEKRLSALEKPAKDQVIDLHHEVESMQDRLRRLEGTKSIKERIDYLEERFEELEKRPPSLDWRLIKDNSEGFHFHGSIGPNTVEPSVDKLETGLSKLEKKPGPEEVVRPIVSRLDDIEQRIDDISGGIDPKRTMANLERRLAALERLAGTADGQDIPPPKFNS